MKATIDTPKRGLPLRCDALVRLFMVLWDDEQGLCVPMMWDEDCEGALCGGAVRSIDRVAIFADRKAARKAIDISAKWNALRKAQGHVYNSDFEGDSRKCLRVVECKPNTKLTALPGAETNHKHTDL